MEPEDRALLDELRSHSRNMADLVDSMNRNSHIVEQNVHALNTLSATVERWNMSTMWLCRLIEWRSKPWWTRGDAPKSPW